MNPPNRRNTRFWSGVAGYVIGVVLLAFGLTWGLPAWSPGWAVFHHFQRTEKASTASGLPDSVLVLEGHRELQIVRNLDALQPAYARAVWVIAPFIGLAALFVWWGIRDHKGKLLLAGLSFLALSILGLYDPVKVMWSGEVITLDGSSGQVLDNGMPIAPLDTVQRFVWWFSVGRGGEHGHLGARLVNGRTIELTTSWGQNRAQVRMLAGFLNTWLTSLRATESTGVQR